MSFVINFVMVVGIYFLLGILTLSPFLLSARISHAEENKRSTDR